MHAADPEVIRNVERRRQPYFVLRGNICALLAARDHVNVFVYDGGIVPDPDGIITAGNDNKTARTVAIRQGEAMQMHLPQRYVQAHHCQQPCWRLAQTEARTLTASGEPETRSSDDSQHDPCRGARLPGPVQ